MAADVVSAKGYSVCLIDAKPSFGRKFLMAGKSGLNLTKDEDAERFAKAYSHSPDPLIDCLSDFGPTDVIRFSQDLGQPVFTGSSGRVFPEAMKASPFLRSWLERLRAQSVQFLTRTKWTGYTNGIHQLGTENGRQTIEAKTAVFAMGGGSWARLGSDGNWVKPFQTLNFETTEFEPSNVGVRILWSEHMKALFGTPLKTERFSSGGTDLAGEAVITQSGLEGTAIYNATPILRKGGRLFIDLLPSKSSEEIDALYNALPAKMSTGNRLRRLGLSEAGRAILMEFARPLKPQLGLGRQIKKLEIPIASLGPLDEAISTAGGLKMAQLDENLMIKSAPGLFCAGEMLDWDAPTGGYLITACLATGLRAGQGASNYLAQR